MAVLATTETFLRYGAETRLDPILVAFANLAAAPLLLGANGFGAWAGVTGAAAVAVLAKGPFGLVPLFAAAVARVVHDRSARVLSRAAIAGAIGCVPLAAFLLADRWILHAGWWQTYGYGQLLASAAGAREDGTLAWWFPFATVAGRFWPGLALIGVLAAIAAVCRRRLRRENLLLAIFCAVMLAALCIPGRDRIRRRLARSPVASSRRSGRSRRGHLRDRGGRTLDRTPRDWPPVRGGGGVQRRARDPFSRGRHPGRFQPNLLADPREPRGGAASGARAGRFIARRRRRAGVGGGRRAGAGSARLGGAGTCSRVDAAPPGRAVSLRTARPREHYSGAGRGETPKGPGRVRPLTAPPDSR